MIKKILFILIFFCISISYSQEKTIDKLSAAPNPFTNSTKISFNSNSETTIFLSVKNVIGKTVFKKNIKVKKGKNSIPFYKNNLATGMYIYSIQNKSKIISKRFVIR